ncbi:hypothetical protein PoB_006451500 [Plakobranchus ocellatus]|uniref:Uncharacterized protein n=1 Tax=Plakobranchus ocellatus TaxID=259542 RepID=A0AAV4D1W1_9GAST|nr:hypothetical protein PoB_006451500 [Plakobranchus ocellatus]
MNTCSVSIHNAIRCSYKRLSLFSGGLTSTFTHRAGPSPGLSFFHLPGKIAIQYQAKMTSSSSLIIAVLLCGMVLTSQAFFFNDNMWMYMMLNPNMMGGMFGGNPSGGAGSPSGMGAFPLAMLASGSDNMKNLASGMLLSNMFRGGSSMGAGAPAGR